MKTYNSLKRMFFLVVLIILTFPFGAFSQLSWMRFGDLNTPRHFFEALPISSEEVLVMGGFTESNGLQTGVITDRCEIINISKKTITSIDNMNESRAEFVALQMPDSNIIVISGVKNSNGELTGKCEVFNRVLKQWKDIGSLLIPRRQHVARFINKDEILVVGGRHANLASMEDAEIFNIKTGKSRQVASYPVVFNLAFASISSQGDFLVCGGREGGPNSFRTKDIFKYDVSNDTWIKTSELPNGIGGGQGIKTWSGQTIFTGGGITETPPVSSDDIFIENNNQYNSIAKMKEGRTWHSLAQWNADTIITISGFTIGSNKSLTSDWINIKQNQTFKGPNVLEPHILFTAVSLPVHDASGNILKPRILAISGLGSNNQNTPIVEILEQEFITTSKPPALTLLKTGCTSAEVNITHSDGIDAAWLVSAMSDNVSIIFAPQPPAKSITATIQLQDPLKIGTYTLHAVSSSGTAAEYSGEIKPSAAVQISASPLGLDGIFTIEPDYPGNVRCRDVSFKNTSSQPVTIDNLYFSHNVEFSIALSQLPLQLQPGESRLLKVCFQALSDGEYRDTLSVNAGCTALQVPLYSEGLPDSFTGTSRCNIPLMLNSRQKTTMLLSEPYPNPAQGLITVNAEFTGTPSASCVLKDIFGTIVQTGSFLKTDDRHGTFTVSSANLTAGLYAFCISTDGGFKTFTVIVE